MIFYTPAIDMMLRAYSVWVVYMLLRTSVILLDSGYDFCNK